MTFPNGVNNAATVLTTPFLNISTLVTFSGERGLLGLAFHPNFATNGYFFVNYIDKSGSGRTAIARYSVSPSTNNVANGVGTVVKIINQPYSNHNGGAMQFGRDGYLYIGMGDGGSANDPLGLSQNVNSCATKNCCECTVNTLVRLFLVYDNVSQKKKIQTPYEQIRYGKDATRGCF
jgi:glucose/arabinose dehydrogenase